MRPEAEIADQKVTRATPAESYDGVRVFIPFPLLMSYSAFSLA